MDNTKKRNGRNSLHKASFNSIPKAGEAKYQKQMSPNKQIQRKTTDQFQDQDRHRLSLNYMEMKWELI